jgi:4-carboxymuconolactone decarboxylase
MSEPRFEPLTPEEMTPEQRQVAEAIVAGPRGGMRGPFDALLRSPLLAERAQKLGEYVRFHSSLPRPLNELAILVTARHWTAQYEWYAHARLAAEAGLAPALIAAIADGQRPAAMAADQTIVYDFCTELLERHAVRDATFAAAREAFGERGIVDLIGASGYYGLVSMVLNVARHPLPDGVAPPLRPLPPERGRA